MGIFVVILSIVITPTFDGFSMLMMAGPMYVVYEVGLFLSWMARPEEGNYLFLRSLWAVVNSPVRAVRWAYRKVWR